MDNLRLPAGLAAGKAKQPWQGKAGITSIQALQSFNHIQLQAITGITGTQSASDEHIREAVARLKSHADLPIAVGFGITSAAQAAKVAAVADAAVVGSALVNQVAGNLDADGKAKPGTAKAVLDLVQELADGVRSARV